MPEEFNHLHALKRSHSMPFFWPWSVYSLPFLAAIDAALAMTGLRPSPSVPTTEPRSRGR